MRLSLRHGGLRSEICDQYPGQGHAKLQELFYCSLSQHRKGKMSYCDLYPVIVLTHSQVIYMFAPLLQGSMTVHSALSSYHISVESCEQEKRAQSQKRMGGKKQLQTSYVQLAIVAAEQSKNGQILVITFWIGQCLFSAATQNKLFNTA